MGVMVMESRVVSTAAPSFLSSVSRAARRSVSLTRRFQTLHCGLAFGEEGDDGESLHHVGDVVHVDVDGGEFAVGGGGDRHGVAGVSEAGAHLVQEFSEGNVSLKARLSQTFDGDGGAGDDGGGGEEIAGVAGVGFDGVGARLVAGGGDLDGRAEGLAALIVNVHVDAELFHHAEGHGDVRLAGDRAEEGDGDVAFGVRGSHEDGGDILGGI